MAHGQYPFWTHDTVAAAVLAGVGMASLQSKLDGVASELNISAITALVHGWPTIALFASLILLVMRSVGETERSAAETKEVEVVNAEPRDLEEAVGEGVDGAQDEESTSVWYAGMGAVRASVETTLRRENHSHYASR